MSAVKRLAQAAVFLSIAGLVAGLLQWADSRGPLMDSLPPGIFDYIALIHVGGSGLALVLVAMAVAARHREPASTSDHPEVKD